MNRFDFADNISQGHKISVRDESQKAESPQFQYKQWYPVNLKMMRFQIRGAYACVIILYIYCDNAVIALS